MTSHLNSHGKTDIKPEMLSGVQTGYGAPHDKYNIRGSVLARTNRKDDIFMQRRLVQNFAFILEWGQETFPACCLVRFVEFFENKNILFDKKCDKILIQNSLGPNHFNNQNIFWA